jgi:hypothetical protein
LKRLNGVKKRRQKRRRLKRPKTRDQTHGQTQIQACFKRVKNSFPTLFPMPFLKSRDDYWRSLAIHEKFSVLIFSNYITFILKKKSTRGAPLQ